MPGRHNTMEDNRRGGMGRSKRPRISRSESRSNSEGSRNFGGERKSFGGDRPRRSFGENSERRSYGEGSRSFGGERKSFSGERKSFGSDRPRRSFGENSERRSYGEGARSFSGERRSFDGEKRSFNGDRKPFGRKPAAGRGGFNSGKKSFTKKDFNYFRNEEESGINKMIERRPQLNADLYSDNDMVNIPIKEEVRLNKYIANSGICSRREADDYITAGLVSVNGVTITELISKRDRMKKDVNIMRSFLNNASTKIDRYSKTEILIKSTVDIAEYQKKLDVISKELRQIDEKIQELNWTTELI